MIFKLKSSSVEQLQKMIESHDIEAVRLGAALLEKYLPRKQWQDFLSMCNKSHYISISYNHIIVRESENIFPHKYEVIDFDRMKDNWESKKEYNLRSRNYKHKLNK